MISVISEMPVTDESYPFSSAERYCHLSANGYVEREYRVDGTANVYRTADEDGGVEVMTADAPYSNRIVVRAPKDPAQASGNVVVEIINPTSFMEIERMWIGTAVENLDQRSSRRPSHGIQRGAEKERPRDIHQVRP